MSMTDEFERGRQQGMKQERALWKLAAEGQAIEAEPPTAAGVEPVTLTTCNCRWQGEKMVQMCTLHEAWRDAVHDWAERAKTAERRTPPTLTDAQCDAIRRLAVELGADSDYSHTDEEFRALIRAAAAGAG